MTGSASSPAPAAAGPYEVVAAGDIDAAVAAVWNVLAAYCANPAWRTGVLGLEPGTTVVSTGERR